ncbi:MAG: zinc-binding dehydrogenase [Alphaproteobacteria bacterium]|nr:zinc-binding dehydrogenase [Alphaproteobacteria bacterium]
MTTMLAARLHEAGKPLQIDQVAVPEPAVGEVLVKVRACGLCGTDIHLAIVGDLPVSYAPITLGHETAGSVAALGPGVEDFNEGDRVALYPSASCGRCRFCLGGRESLCSASQVYGMARDGGLAEYITAPARSLLRLPESVPFDVGAVVTDGIATPFHALRARGKLKPGETVGVFGCGGLGTHAIQFARLMGAAGIVAIDIDGPARERALELGADLALDPRDDNATKQIRSKFGRGLDLALEFVGRADTVELALRCLDKAGRLVVVGIGMERPKLPPLAAFVGLEQAVLGSFGMDRADIEDIYALVVAGRIDLSDSVSARYPLGEADEALQRLASKEAGVVRVVVEP